MKSSFRICLMTLACALAASAHGQAPYPVKPVRVIVPQPPGGSIDATARIMGQGLSAVLGKQFVVENRPGAGGNIAAEAAAKSVADGYTLLMGFITNAINATLYEKLNYSVTRDFAPVSLLVSGPFCVSVHPSVPVKSVMDLVALAKARPGQLDFGYAGNGPLLAGVMFLDMANVKMNQISYKGSPAAMTALVGGEVSVVFNALTGAYSLGKTGKVRILAVTTAQRVPMAPELPTISESGLKGYEATTWYGFLVPAGTPNAIIARLYEESVKLLKQAEIRERLAAVGVDPVGSTPEQFGAYIRSEIDKWARIVKVSGARPD
jgi:tripartite-type tricarboxylate transporter receptor subunit TctC